MGIILIQATKRTLDLVDTIEKEGIEKVPEEMF